MIRYYVFILLALFVSSCQGTKFSRLTDQEVKDLGKEQMVRIDESYRLYMRQVIKKTGNDGLSRPVVSNTISAHDTIIERQYLLISETAKKLIVWSNIPSNYISFYNEADVANALDVTLVEIDIWYMNQLRFGNWNAAALSADFEHVRDGPPQCWNFVKAGNDLVLYSVTETDPLHAEKLVRFVEPAYAVEMRFFPVAEYTILFKEHKVSELTDKMDKLSTNSIPTHTPPSNIIYLRKNNKDWYTIFNIPGLAGERNNIVFGPKRMYAAPTAE